MKRRSRHELKQEIKALKEELQITGGELEKLRIIKKELSERLETLGSRLDMDQAMSTGPLKCIEIKPIPYGDYIALPNYSEVPVNMIAETKKIVIQKLVHAFVESGYVQFIIKDAQWPFGGATVGAKMYVVPWEQTVFGRKITINRK